jgi:hypothetical protein
MKYIEQGYERPEYTVLKTIRPFFDTANEYLVIRVKDTTFCCQEDRWNEYVLGCSEDLWRRVDDWISDYVMPHVTRRTINYNTMSSYKIKDECERCIGAYVAEELIMALISAKNVPGANKHSMRLYPTSVHFPLSSKYNLNRGVR